MVSENNSEEQSGEVEEPVSYKDLVIEEPERVVEAGEYEAIKSVSEAEEETQQRTDLQAVLQRLHPKYADKRLDNLLQPISASRIFPDNYLDLNFLVVMSLIEEKATAGEAVDVMSIITMVQAGTSIGYEGRARIEDLEVAGVIHEEEMEKLTKELGI